MDECLVKEEEQKPRRSKAKKTLTVSFVVVVFLIIIGACYSIYWRTERRAVQKSQHTEINTLDKQKFGLLTVDGVTVGITDVEIDNKWSIVSGTRTVVHLTAFAASEQEKIKYGFFAYRMKNGGNTWTTTDAVKRKDGRFTLSVRDFVPEANYECCFVAVTKSGKHTSQMVDVRVEKDV